MSKEQSPLEETSKLNSILLKLQAQKHQDWTMGLTDNVRQDANQAIKQLAIEAIDEVTPPASADLVHSHTDIVNTLGKLRQIVQAW